MDTGEHFEVKDMGLAEQGQRSIEWAESQMGALMTVRRRFEQEKPLQDVKIGLALHVTKETAALVRTLRTGGADVAITGCNPLSAQDDVCAALAKEGVKIWAYKGESNEDYYRYLAKVIEFKPHITIDDGCDLINEIHTKHPELIPEIWGGCEETTTGIIRLQAMQKAGALKYPVVGVNESKTKHLMDNIKGTGQSTIDGVLRATNILLAGKTFVVAGYGSCGKGLADRAKGMDAKVVVTEVDPFRALQAVMDGHRVMPMEEAVKIGDVFVTVTGNKWILRPEHFKAMKDGAVLANSGHFDIEIDLASLDTMASQKRQIREFLEEFTVDGKHIYVCGQGRLINLAAAEGHPSSIMAMSFVNQAFACEFIVKNKGNLDPGVHILPPEMDQEVAQLQLNAMGITIDSLTEEQTKYLNTWEEGT